MCDLSYFKKSPIETYPGKGCVKCPSFLDKRPLKQGCNSDNSAGLFLERTVIHSRCRNDWSPVVMSSRASRYV
jgi:hypothetical protein